MVFQIRDGMDLTEKLDVYVTVEGGGLCIRPEGYGDFDSEDGCGSPVYLDFFNRKLQVVVFPDINKEDHQVIDMSEAKETNRVKS